MSFDVLIHSLRDGLAPFARSGAVLALERPAAALAGWLNPVGVFVFALSGAVAAARRGLDLFGVLVLAFVTAACGGIIRDVLLGVTPPTSIAAPDSLVIACAAGLIGFAFSRRIEGWEHPIAVLDAVGLGLFAVSGTELSLAHHVNPVMAALLGTLTGVGGGLVRDVLSSRTPLVLRDEIYATAALLGGLIVAAGHALALPTALVGLVGAMACCGLRLASLAFGWRLPARRLGWTAARLD